MELKQLLELSLMELLLPLIKQKMEQFMQLIPVQMQPLGLEMP
jgi:hypothetical protein